MSAPAITQSTLVELGAGAAFLAPFPTAFCGAASTIQASSTATGNPMTSASRNARATQTGRSGIGATLLTSCSSTQATTA